MEMEQTILQSSDDGEWHMNSQTFWTLSTVCI